MSNVERQLEISRRGGHGLDSLCELKNACEGEMAGAPTVECDVSLEVTASGVGSSAAEESPSMKSEEQQKSLEWSLVVKHGRRRRNYVDGQTPPTKQRANKAKAKQRMSKPIIGTGAR